MLDVRFDFEVFDDLRTVTYRRAFSTSARDNYAVVSALKHQVSSTAETPDGVTTATVVWNVPVAQLPYAKPSDLLDEELEDGTTRTWTILTVDQVVFGVDWRLTCRDQAVAHDLTETANLYLPNATNDAAGAWTPEFVPWRLGLAARFQEVGAEAAEERGLRGDRRRFNVFLSEPLADLTIHHRLEREGDGQVFEIRGWTPPQTPADLFVIDAEVSP